MARSGAGGEASDLASRLGTRIANRRGWWAEAGRLWYGYPLVFRPVPLLRFEPEGLVLVQAGCPERLFAWDANTSDAVSADPSSWRFERWWKRRAVPGFGATRGWKVEVPVSEGGGVPAGPFVEVVSLRDRGMDWRVMQVVLVPAFLRYLATTPAARSGLSDEILVARLVPALQHFHGRSGPQVPFQIDRHTVYRATQSVLAQEGVRRFGARAVQGEPWPDPVLVASKVKALVGPYTCERLGDAGVDREVARAYRGDPWPFGLLLGTGSSPPP